MPLQPRLLQCFQRVRGAVSPKPRWARIEVSRRYAGSRDGLEAPRAVPLCLAIHALAFDLRLGVAVAIESLLKSVGVINVSFHEVP